MTTFKEYFEKSINEEIDDTNPKAPEATKFDCKVCDNCAFTAQKVDKELYPNYCPSCGTPMEKTTETQVIELSKMKPLNDGSIYKNV